MLCIAADERHTFLIHCGISMSIPDPGELCTIQLQQMHCIKGDRVCTALDALQGNSDALILIYTGSM